MGELLVEGSRLMGLECRSIIDGGATDERGKIYLFALSLKVRTPRHFKEFGSNTRFASTRECGYDKVTPLLYGGM